MIRHWVLRSVFFLFLFLQSTAAVFAEDYERPILIISSYNPETFQTSQNISEFLEEYKLLGGTHPVVIENMNCKSFSEAPLWKSYMKNIFDKYRGERRPALVILLGQEAWASYISQEQVMYEIPLLCGMVSRNAIILPDDTVDLKNWEPESLDVLQEQKIKVAGYLYDYDIEKNVQLIRDFYPNVQHIAFVSDNSYGGVTLQAYVKKEMQKFPDVDLILLDGRKHTIYTIVDKIAKLPENTVILMGTWRVDKNEGYFMRNATYSMMSANPKLPAFSMTSIGLGHWALGGYIPSYRTIGKDLARQANAVLEKKNGEIRKIIQFIPNRYEFDAHKLKEAGLSEKILPQGAKLLNKDISFWEKYRFQLTLIALAFLFLLVGFFITLYFYLRTKKLKDELEESEIELVAAKEKAEESDRLKSAFLANMSHEIRTPLNAIVGFSNVLVSDDFSEDERQRFVNIIQTNSDLLLRLINDILDISRLETGRLKFTYEKHDLIHLCRGILSTTACSRKGGVVYVFNPAVETFEIETDGQRLQQILINLLSNANKFTENGEIRLDLKIDEPGNKVFFSVTDTGCGIPLEKQQVIFDRFAKLNEYAQGTGLGLAICRITVNMLGGEIWVDKDYTGGARFVFTHPIHRP
ncbi:MAG: HAMP domain-containing histidine kinase [Odoribacter sp.]|nr:HAMP domain-containing histidine kinase [Odoribacter sp.]